MKNFRAYLFIAMTLFITLTGCNKSNNNVDNNTNNNKSVKVGIAQFAPHGSLDNCVEGFKLGLAEGGYEEGKNLVIDYKNAQGDMASTYQIAKAIADANVDLMCAVATPMAQAAYNAVEGKVPLIYTAVTDPIAAKLANEDGSYLDMVTGTSDKLPIDAQLQMIRALQPNATSIGILYTTSETNSVSAIEEYKAIAGDFGFTIIAQGISQGADMPMAATDLVAKVDCVTNLTDNTVVNNLAVLLDAADKANIPVYGSEIEQVKNGCLAAQGLDYVELGKQTGLMAARILDGEDINNIPYKTITEYSLYLNPDVLDNFDIEIPQDLINDVVEVS